MSTYFIVKSPRVSSTPLDASKHVLDISNDMSGPPPSVLSAKSTYTATFRGRAMHGLGVSLPQGYMGLVLHSKDASIQSSSPTPTIPMKRKRGGDSTPSKLLEKKKGRGIRKTRSSAAMDMDDIPDIGGADDMYTLMSQVDDSSESSSLVVAGGTPNNSMNKCLTPVRAFGSIVVWQPDMPVDEGRDEYIRAMDEWTRLANVVRGLYYFPNLCSLTGEQLHSV